MHRFWSVVALVMACTAQGAEAPAPAAAPGLPEAEDLPQQPHAPGIESPGYVWNEIKDEELLALKASGDPARGEEAYAICRGCHGGDALGDATGYYPRLAGQHISVLVKQMADVRVGRRDNPKMFPYANEHLISTQEIADIAAFLHHLPVVEEHGRGPGTGLARGAELYGKDCESCHGVAGEGKGEKFYPRVAGQHYRYLLRQAREIRGGVRRNANPEMVDAIKPYNDADLEAVSDYMASLPAVLKR